MTPGIASFLLAMIFAALMEGEEISPPEPKILEVLEIDKVWTGHPVGFCLLTSGQYQFAAYYDADRQMTIASRMLDENNWLC
jgi:hypothetical protein